MTPPPAHPPRPAGSHGEGGLPQPTSGRENSGLMYFFIGAAALALLIVLGFNTLGPEGAARSGIGDGPATSPAGATTGGPDPGATRSEMGIPDGKAAGAATNRSAGQGNSGAVTPPTPQAADTPAAPGRESLGAPLGGSPQSRPGMPQSSPQGTSGEPSTGGTSIPPGVSPDAPRALPAIPPASR